MNCSVCGVSNDPVNERCIQCGAQLQSAPISNPSINSMEPQSFQAASHTAVPPVFAGVGHRFAATLIDTVIGVLCWLFTCFVIALYVEITNGGTEPTNEQINTLAVWTTLATLGLGVLYYIFLEALAGGTLGKLILGLPITMSDGRDITFKAAVLRNIGRIFDGFLFYLVAALCVWTTDKNQRIGDMMADTVVIKKSSAAVVQPAQTL